jgi:hypothetical protein
MSRMCQEEAYTAWAESATFQVGIRSKLLGALI